MLDSKFLFGLTIGLTFSLILIIFGFVSEAPENKIKLTEISPSNITVDDRIDGWRNSSNLRKRFRRRFIYEKFKTLWFDITFEIDLDDKSIILVKHIFEETFNNARKASSEFERSIIAGKFNKEVRKIIGEENYEKLLNKREGRMPERYNFGKTRYIKHE